MLLPSACVTLAEAYAFDYLLNGNEENIIRIMIVEEVRSMDEALLIETDELLGARIFDQATLFGKEKFRLQFPVLPRGNGVL